MVNRIAPILLLVFVSSCAKLPVDATLNKYSVNVIQDTVSFAVVGDFGQDTWQEDSVAKMIKSWNPEFIITTGDNNYTFGSASTIEKNISKYYGDYIYNPDAPETMRCKGKAAEEKMNRFFPCPGNHDSYSVPAIQPYLDYFTLPGNERNYDFTWGPVHFFSVYSGVSGQINSNSDEAKWLKKAASESRMPFKIVYFHHPPYSSGNHGSSSAMQWPFAEWGIDAVLCGHEHFYMRINDSTAKSPVYIITGNGGNATLYNCNANSLDAGRFQIICDNQHWGALKVKADTNKAVIEYYRIGSSTPTDSYTITK